MSRPPAIKRQFSSGGIVFRRTEKVIEVVLVYVRNNKAWSIPKGIIEKDEDAHSTALREVREETGLTGEILEEIGKTSYWYSRKQKTVKIYKTVYFFLIKYLSGSTDDHDHEVDEARWFTVDEAIEKLKYKGEKDLMRKAKLIINKKY